MGLGGRRRSRLSRILITLYEQHVQTSKLFRFLLIHILIALLFASGIFIPFILKSPTNFFHLQFLCQAFHLRNECWCYLQGLVLLKVKRVLESMVDGLRLHFAF
jgi:hypothetical protein